MFAVYLSHVDLFCVQCWLGVSKKKYNIVKSASVNGGASYIVHLKLRLASEEVCSDHGKKVWLMHCLETWSIFLLRKEKDKKENERWRGRERERERERRERERERTIGRERERGGKGEREREREREKEWEERESERVKERERERERERDRERDREKKRDTQRERDYGIRLPGKSGRFCWTWTSIRSSWSPWRREQITLAGCAMIRLWPILPAEFLAEFALWSSILWNNQKCLIRAEMSRFF